MAGSLKIDGPDREVILLSGLDIGMACQFFDSLDRQLLRPVGNAGSTKIMEGEILDISQLAESLQSIQKIINHFRYRRPLALRPAGQDGIGSFVRLKFYRITDDT